VHGSLSRAPAATSDCRRKAHSDGTAAPLTVLGATSAALGAGSSPITEKVLGAAGISRPYTIPVTRPADVIVAKATVPPGASFGWQCLRAAVVVVVKSGPPTLYDSADRTARNVSPRARLHRAPAPTYTLSQRGSGSAVGNWPF
jgi:hypothetical protein